jgi:hypothetical protein
VVSARVPWRYLQGMAAADELTTLLLEVVAGEERRLGKLGRAGAPDGGWLRKTLGGRGGYTPSGGGASGAYVRKRRRVELRGPRFEGGDAVGEPEYDVGGSLPLDKAEALDVDPAALEQAVLSAAKGWARDARARGLGVPAVRCSYGVALGCANDVRVYNWAGREVALLELAEGRVAVVGVWASWSPRAAALCAAASAWTRTTWGGSVAFVSVSVDDSLLRAQSYVKEQRQQDNEHQHQHQHGEQPELDLLCWAGFGRAEHFRWTQSDIARSFCIREVPYFALVDQDGNVVAETLVAAAAVPATAAPDACELAAFNEALQSGFAPKISSLLVANPALPPSLADASADVADADEGEAAARQPRGDALSRLAAELRGAGDALDHALVTLDEQWAQGAAGPRLERARLAELVLLPAAGAPPAALAALAALRRRLLLALEGQEGQ